MIPAHSAPAQPAPTPQDGLVVPLAPTSDWRRAWRDAIRDPRELLELLDLPQVAARLSADAQAQFPMRVPRGFAMRMRRGDPADPLLRQVLPLDDEDRLVPGFDLDAVGDAAANAGTGILHKYRGRALLVATGSCAVHCRYCFRRHFPYAEQTAAANHWQAAIDFLRNDSSISELILSGGDPLSLATGKLAELTGALRGIASLRRLRLHTRLPVVLPERVDATLLDWLRTLPWPVSIVIHANHPNEIDVEVAQALRRLRETGAVLLNQSVLLRGVNDDARVLAELSEVLFDAGVLPYYLHQLDRVAGVAHFEVDDQCARALHSELQSLLPGYLVPRLVREVAGAPGKTPL
ncbi:MAG: EF-P beta-lysylation protein EpmB [Gammaproteobacteria bacterium RIFCSPHIGHO2_12_FULL_63_22]|nr:MAG: EF-P beta-lysylation protein EpmB [Gammaproteobacteria bacterium RIFCSPHIGHO2_12_FULL_63_22]